MRNRSIALGLPMVEVQKTLFKSQWGLVDPDPVPIDPHLPDERRPKLHAQTLRILNRLRRGPATALELIAECAAPNYRARVSDLRAAGYVVQCADRGDGVNEYRLIYEP